MSVSGSGGGRGGEGHGLAGDSIVLEEEIDPNYVPTQVCLRKRRLISDWF